MNVAEKKALLAAFVLRPCHWDAQAEAWARVLPHDSAEDYGEYFKKQVAAGEFQMYELLGATGRTTLLFLRIDRSYSLPEMVIEGTISHDKRPNMCGSFLPQIEDMARLAGCATVRFHTMRAGLIKVAIAGGYQICEVICRKEVRHVG